MSVRRRDLKVLLLFVWVVLSYIFFERYYKLRESYYKDYLRHKEVMFLLANYKDRKREEPTEGLIKEVFSLHGVEFISFRKTDTGYEVQGGNLRGEKLPQLVFSIEDRGIKITKLKAVDNTGQGIFDLYMLLR